MYTTSAARFYINVVLLAGMVLLLLMPGIFSELERNNWRFSLGAVKAWVLAILFLLMPVVFFYRRIKWYLYLLACWILLTPLFIYALLLFEVKPGSELIFLILQSNVTEMQEIARGQIGWFFLFTFLYLFIYLFLVKKFSVKCLPIRPALSISIFSVFLFAVLCYRNLFIRSLPASHFFSRYYPMSIISGVADAYAIINRNNLDQARQFSFGAYKKDTVPQRQIYVFIIGETSRYDRWQINGYHRATSPRLQQQKNLVRFTDMISGSNLTWLSVPQMITRASPDDMDRQFREKSIIQAFQDAGFKTAWLSTQTDQQIIWQGSITMHAKTADVVHFARTYSPIFELEEIYDEQLLPRMDSIIRFSNDNLFIVLHTMGNHWSYAKRFPAGFDVFKPSGKTFPEKAYDMKDYEMVSNSYDNSILYADFIIDSVIRRVEKEKTISYVAFLSDHGEELFDGGHKELRFHTRVGATTLHVPFFLWTSDAWCRQYPEKRQAVIVNSDKKTGAENVFYSLLDMANISFPQMDVSRSVASFEFRPSEQKFYDAIGRSCRYAEIGGGGYAASK
jgi:Predicted membrane-associated, metal-dependent hydrolase